MTDRALTRGEDAAARDFAESLLRMYAANDPEFAYAWAIAVIGYTARFIAGYCERGPEVSARLQDIADETAMHAMPRRVLG